MCALSTSGRIWIWLSTSKGGMDSQQINSCLSHMHNHNFLRPYFGQCKLENMNLQLDALSGSLSKVHKQTGRQTGSVVGYPNTHALSCLGTAIKSFSSGFRRLLRCRDRNHNQREEVKCGVCESRIMLQKILHTLRLQPEYATVALPTKTGDWPRSSCSLKALF